MCETKSTYVKNPYSHKSIFHCPCGGQYTLYGESYKGKGAGKKRHEKTKKHLKYILSVQPTTDEKGDVEVEVEYDEEEMYHTTTTVHYSSPWTGMDDCDICGEMDCGCNDCY